MNKDGQTSKSAYVARGLAIVTGEVVPDVPQSRLARCVMTNIKEGSIDKNKLTRVQNNSEQLAYAMKLYISLMLANLEKLKVHIKYTYNRLCSTTYNQSLHGRTAEIGNVLKLGFDLFTNFLKAYNIIDENTKKALDADANITIDGLLVKQSEEIEELKPDKMFFNALEQLIATKQILLLDRFLLNEISSYNKNEFAGFIDEREKCYYLIPDIVFNKVSAFYSQGDAKFPVNARTLWKYLAENDLLEMYQSKTTGKKRYKTPVTIQGQCNSYVKIKIPETDGESEHKYSGRYSSLPISSHNAFSPDNRRF